MRHHERVIVQRVLSALDINRCQRVRRILQAEIDDILRCDPQEARLGHAQEAIDVRSIARPDFQGPVYVRE
jgi:hypothetical protein